MSRYRQLRPVSAVDAAYIAGLIDGEGTISLSRRHSRESRQPVVSIANTELCLLEFVLNAVGPSHRRGERAVRGAFRELPLGDPHARMQRVLRYEHAALRSRRTACNAPSDDAAEDLWRSYYASNFNPTRLKVAAVQSHMPKKFWRNLPESELIPSRIAASQERTLEMIMRPATTARHKRRAAAAPVARKRALETSLDAVREDAAHCKDCPLWKNATQTVFGEGSERAKIVFVGEQPGDQEDLAGLPFVGPAGKLLDRALADAGIDRKKTYVTNAVKHFKFEPRGKRRIHKKPSDLEIAACHQWIERELDLVQPELIVVLGATAARSVFGRATPIEKNRGRIIKATADDGVASRADILVTIHPSFLLRVPPEDKPAAYERFVQDLKLIHPYAS